MCGIAGLLALDGRSAPDRALVERMAATLVHRGPDDAGVVVDGPVALAARRLSIIDLEGGHQPMASEDGRVLACQNGELYNHAALHAELERAGHRFATRCDTEVLVHGFEEWGVDLLARLRGMFACAIWDGHSLVLARDAFGIKPLYWTSGSGWLAFASELRALLELPWVSREVDPEALECYLAFNSIPSPLTPYRAIRKLPAGHYLRDGEVVRWRRFAPARPREVAPGELLEVLRDSVRAHLVADVPVGVLLSGGVDSGSLAALATQEAGRVSTFSVGFRERSFDELALARAVARKWDTDHHELVLEPEASLLEPLAAAYDEPLGDSSALPSWLVARLARQHVKTALSGEGGDELFGGYFTYQAALLAQRYGRVAALARPLAEALPTSTRRVPLDYKLKRFTRAAALPPLERHHGFKEILSADARAAVLDGRRAAEFDGRHAAGVDGRRAAGVDVLFAMRSRFAETEGADLVARLMDVDRTTYLVDDLLFKTDRAGMTHSLELRVPFLDPVVAELALQLPLRARIAGRRKKVLLRQAVAPLLPEEVIRGPKKGFSIPAAAWLRGPLLPFAREALASHERHRWLDRRACEAVLDRHVRGEEDLSRQVWGLMMLALWFDGPSGPSS